ncbi:hypothetical protein ACFQJ7_08025 [Halovenus rubra]|uniref:Uncharacterized protein n=2 Tax=Halovenus rubra TaxID=869890 RepID=A0ACC7E633_9EURY|nr:hypothetical protein [Halovenus rubra]
MTYSCVEQDEGVLIRLEGDNEAFELELDNHLDTRSYQRIA